MVAKTSDSDNGREKEAENNDTMAVRCLKCCQVVIIKARGLCASCYNTALARNELRNYGLVGGRRPELVELGIYLNKLEARMSWEV